MLNATTLALIRGFNEIWKIGGQWKFIFSDYSLTE